MSPIIPTLYSFRRCPYAMRARMAIAVSGAKVNLREIILRDKPAEMIAASPKATVPVLIDGDVIVDQSLVIMGWALAKNDPENWLGYCQESEALIEENDGPFKHHLDRYKYATRYKDENPRIHKAEGFKFLQKLEDHLSKNTYLFADERSVADIAIFPFVRQFRIPDKEWFDSAPIPKVQQWLDHLMSSDLFTSIMKKYPTWKDSGEEFLVPEVNLAGE